MDVFKMAGDLLGALKDNPDLVSQFVSHPYSTTAEATGTDAHISKDDMSQILTQVAAQVSGQHLGQADVASAAQSLLGQNGGSVHALTQALFGAGTQNQPSQGPSMADIAIQSIAGGVAARGLAAMITGALGAAQGQRPQSQKK